MVRVKKGAIFIVPKTSAGVANLALSPSSPSFGHRIEAAAERAGEDGGGGRRCEALGSVPVHRIGQADGGERPRQPEGHLQPHGRHRGGNLFPIPIASRT